MTQALLDGDTQTYDFDRGFTRHPIDGNNGQGIVVKLGQPYIINTIKMLLWDRDMRQEICSLLYDHHDFLNYNMSSISVYKMFLYTAFLTVQLIGLVYIL